MKTTKNRITTRLLWALRFALLAPLAPASLEAVELKLGPDLPPLSLHGFASEGFLLSNEYDYLGSSRRGSFKFTEAGLNVSFNPLPRTRIAAQAFIYDAGEAGRYHPALDYALAEYTFSSSFGIRAGRIRRPQGIYNDVQDVDVGRTFVLLPQGIYDARWRDFYGSLDGVEVFGTIPLKKAGSLSYGVYAGFIRPSTDGGIALQIRDGLPAFSDLDSIDSAQMFGGQIWWNTPVDGLRFGAAGGYVPTINFATTIQTPAGSIHPDNRSEASFQQYSAEYLWKAWTFQTECSIVDNNAKPAGRPDTHSFSWYASAAYRFNKHFEAGAYYTEYYGDRHHAGNSLQYQKDAALALRFDLSNSWTFKVEGHHIKGTGLLQDRLGNPVQRDNGWWMMAVKATFSF
ncbi:MAG: hypothetical protein ABIP85_24470 [Chthoniobacteraceae bacterium]